MFTMHGTTMIFFVAMPLVFGFANYLVPLMIGARDMAFPRLNAFSFWMSALGGLFLYFSFFGGDGLYGAGGAPDVGWFAYAPLTSRTFSVGHSTDFWTLSCCFRHWQRRNRDQYHHHNTVHALSGNDARQNAAARLAEPHNGGPGDSRRKPPYRGTGNMLLVDRYLGGHFFGPRGLGRQPPSECTSGICGHPEVYVLVIPAFGIASEIIPVFSRKAIFGYPVMVGATVGIGFVA